jgi:CRISPR/Cas system CMR-associated protein Cmr1 (group 7 of RAMP superfamily)
MDADLKVYQTVCKDRFTKLETEIDAINVTVGEIHAKIFNGHTHAIESIQNDMREMKQLAEVRKRSRSLFVRDVILTLLGSGGIISLILMQVFK